MSDEEVTIVLTRTEYNQLVHITGWAIFTASESVSPTYEQLWNRLKEQG